jgi:regulatory protein
MKASGKNKYNLEIDRSRIIDKMQKYCAYQERAESEVVDKLKKYELNGVELDEIISQLKEQGYLDNQRFAKVYAGGKFRNNQWGKIRIRYELQRKAINEQVIEEALESIDQGDYRRTIHDLIRKKKKSIREQNPYIRKNKLAQYMFTKGFESELVCDILNHEFDHNN